MKRSLVVFVLALSVLGGCASTLAPAPAVAASAKASGAPATTAPVAKLTKDEAETALLGIIKAQIADPDERAYTKALQARDYKTVRKTASKTTVGGKTAIAAFEAVAWPDEMKSDMDAYVVLIKKEIVLRNKLAAASTDAEAESIHDARVKEIDPADEATIKRVLAYSDHAFNANK